MLASKCFAAVVILLAPWLLPAANRIESSLTVLMDFEAPHSDASLRSLRTSLNHILNPAGMNVDVQIRSDLPSGAQFGELVIFKMKGSCSLVAAPVPAGPLYDERGPLAMAYVSDGQVLHFGEVECDRVRQSLQRLFGKNTSLECQRTYGSALAIVIAHEVYHMLGNIHAHTRQGLTKAELSASELISPRLDMPSLARETIQRGLHSELP